MTEFFLLYFLIQILQKVSLPHKWHRRAACGPWVVGSDALPSNERPSYTDTKYVKFVTGKIVSLYIVIQHEQTRAIENCSQDKYKNSGKLWPYYWVQSTRESGIGATHTSFQYTAVLSSCVIVFNSFERHPAYSSALSANAADPTCS